MGVFIYYYRLNISVDEFLVLSISDIVKYPEEFVNVENITLWKYLTKEEGYYNFNIEITDEN